MPSLNGRGLQRLATIVGLPALPDFIVGIDPGVQTGVAILPTADLVFAELASVQLWQLHRRLYDMHAAGVSMVVFFEDARLVKGGGGGEVWADRQKWAARRKGVGSINRDCGALFELLDANGIPNRGVSPSAKGSKLDAEAFKWRYRWQGRTNEHTRDAGAMAHHGLTLYAKSYRLGHPSSPAYQPWFK